MADAAHRPRVCVVDHGYHRTTGSNRFFLELLQARAEVTVLRDEHWRGGEPVRAEQINAARPDAVVYFQIRPTRAQLARLSCRNVTWVPMRDDVVTRPARWRRLHPFRVKVVSFSRDITQLCAAAGLSHLDVRYYPPPEPPAAPAADAPVVLWWYRHAAVNWPMVETLLGDSAIQRLVIRHAPDPGQPALEIPPAARSRWPIEDIHGWLPEPDYRALMDRATHVIAPRLIEGIGFPVLEAMARGQCVIAADRPTMNESITDGVTGVLFDPEAPRPVDLTAGLSCGPRARAAVADGHARWLTQAPELAAFVLDRPARRRHWHTAVHRLRAEI